MNKLFSFCFLFFCFLVAFSEVAAATPTSGHLPTLPELSGTTSSAHEAPSMMAGVLVSYTNSMGTALVKQDVTACDGLSLNQARFIVTNNAADNMTVSLDLPPGIFYEPGSVMVVATSGGLTVAESNIGDLNAPVFAVTPADLAAGNSFTLQWARSNNMTCDAYDIAVAGGTFKDNISVTTDLGTTEEVDPTIRSYNLLFASLSLSGANPVTTNVGSTVSRDVTITNGGLGFLGGYTFTIKNGSGTMTNSLVTVPGGTVITPVSTVNGISTYSIPASIVAEYGDNDAMFDNSEQMTFTRTYTVLSCDNASSYLASWGCPDACMLTSVLPQQTNIADGVPVVRYASDTRVQGTNMCDNGIVDVVIQNFGTESAPGAGTAFDLVEYIGYTLSLSSPIEVRSGINIVGASIGDGAGTFTPMTLTGGPAGTNPLVDFSQLTSAFGGLIDADNDGQFDDLPVGASFTLRIEIEYVCVESCNPNHSGVITVNTNFNNQCDDPFRGRVNRTRWGTFSRFSSGSVVAPTDVSDGEILPVEICMSRDYSGTLFDCPTNEVTLDIPVPAGFSLASADFFGRINNTTSNLVSATQEPGAAGMRDTVRVVGEFVSGQFCYEVNLLFQCATYMGEDDFSYEINYQCDVACGCTERWLCGTFGSNAHCPGCEVGGLTLLDSDFERITYGYESPTSLALADPTTLSEAQLNVVMACDTVKGTFPGIMVADVDGVDFDNGTFELQYNLVGGNTIFRPAGADLQFFDASNGMALTTVPLGAPVENTGGGLHTLTYDLTRPLAQTGQVLAVNDSVLLCAYYYIEKNQSLSANPIQMAGLKTRYYSIAGPGAFLPEGTEVTCDEWAGDLLPHQRQISRFDGTGPIINEGCNLYSYGSRLTFFSGVEDPYPGEIRPYTIIDSIVITTLNNDVIPVSGFVASLNAIGTNTDGYNILTDLVPFATVTADRKKAVFINDGSWPLGDLGIGGVGGYSFGFNLINSCESLELGTVQLDYFYQDYGYATDTDCREEASSARSRPVSNDLATIDFTDLTGTVSATTDVVSWNTQIANLTNLDAGFAWIGIEEVIVGSTEVLSVTNTTTGTPYTLLPYEDGVWVQVTDNLGPAATVPLTITARISDCNVGDLRVFAAANCPGYPDPDPTVSPCEEVEAILRATPLNSEIQIELTDEPDPPIDLCTPIAYDVLVNSAQAADLDNPRLGLLLKPGLSIAGNIEVFYPNDMATGTTETVSFTTVGDTVFINLEEHSAIGTDGMPGTVNALTTAEREALVSFSFLTDCDFPSGATIEVLGFGDRPCGDPADNNGVRVVSGATFIDGAEPAYLANVEFDAAISPLVNCDGMTVDVALTLISLTSDMTSDQDTLTITIDEGLVYQPGSFTSTDGLVVARTTTLASGQTEVKIAMPTPPIDLSGGAVNLMVNFMINAANASGCSISKDITAELSNTITGLTCASEPGGECDNTKIILGEATAPVVLEKTEVALEGTDACIVSPGLITVTGNLEVASEDIGPDGSVEIQFFCADATGEPTGSLLGTYSLNGPVTAGTTLPFNVDFLSECAPTNRIIASISNEDNCVCSSTMVIVDIGEQVTAEAGEDQTICATGSANLASAGAMVMPLNPAIGATWTSSGDGTFDDIDGVFGVATSYTPGPLDIKDGQVTLTLTTNDPSDAPVDNNACRIATDEVVITILNVDCGDFPWDGDGE